MLVRFLSTVLAALAIFVSSVSISAQSNNSPKGHDFTRGADLYRQCKNWHVKDATTAQIDEANQCLSYIEGFVDGKGPAYKFGCFIGFSYREMIEAYLEYMTKHTDAMQENKRLGLDAALTLKFCPYWEEPPKSK
jgi:hypothetical protein